MKKATISLFLAVFLVFPSVSMAQVVTPPQTQEEITAQLRDLMNQLILIVQQLTDQLNAKLAEQGATLAQQSTDIQAIKANTTPKLGATLSPTPTPYSIHITYEIGHGSWATHAKECAVEGGLHDANYDCDDNFLDGMVKFTINQPYKTALITYGVTDGSANQVTTNGFDTSSSAKNYGVHGVFLPNKTYTWKVTATNDAGQTATDSGTLTMPDYPY